MMRFSLALLLGLLTFPALAQPPINMLSPGSIVLDTGAACPSGNPMRFMPTTADSPILGLPTAGFYLQLNRRTDCTFGALPGDYRLYYNFSVDEALTAAAKDVNPVGVPLSDDSSGGVNTAYFAHYSRGQKVINPCSMTSGFTVSGGQLTSVTLSAIPAACRGTGYPASTTVEARLIEGGQAKATFRATTDATGAISGFTGLPTGSGIGVNATLFLQPKASTCIDNGCVFDHNNQLYFNHQPPNFWPRAGSIVASLNLAGATNDGTNHVGPQAMYGQIYAGVSNPDVNHPRGYIDVATANDPLVDGGASPRARIEQGIRLLAPGEADPGDPGSGNLNANGLVKRIDRQCANRSVQGTACTVTVVYELKGLGVAGWTTIQILTPYTTSGVTQAMVSCRIAGHSSAIAKIGVRRQVNSLVVANGNLGGGVVESVSQPDAPQIQVAPSGGSFLVQVASNDASHALDSGYAKCEYDLTDATGAAQSWLVH